MWVHPSVETAGEGVEDITFIIKTHPLPFPCHSLSSVAHIEFFSSHFYYFKSASGNVIWPKMPPRVPVLSNWAHHALWKGGNMVKTSGWTTPSSYNALGETIRWSLCLDRPFSMAKLLQNGKPSQIIPVTAWNWKQAVSLDSGSPNPSKVHTHTPYRSMHDQVQYPICPDK